MTNSDKKKGGRGKGIRCTANRLRKASEDTLKKATENLEEVQDATNRESNPRLSPHGLRLRI